MSLLAILDPFVRDMRVSTHASALDMHHLTSKDFLIAELITAVTFTPGTRTIENLLREATKCIPL